MNVPSMQARTGLAACPTFDRSGRDADAFRRALADNLHFRLGQAAYTASMHDLYLAVAHTVRDHLSDRWAETMARYFDARPKFVYYLSAEYLPGRQLLQNLTYTGLLDTARAVFRDLHLNLDDVLAMEAEPGLGNGGLGRLASCFMDSLATLDIPAVGYGIRYDYGIFRQGFEDGWQVERPDEWLLRGNPWEFAQTDHVVEVKFGGRTEYKTLPDGRLEVRWHAGDTVLGEPYHTLVPGYGTRTVNLLRLWRARASSEFDFHLFNDGDFMRAVARKTHSENITKVLYPNDATPQGRELRLRQQYFFVACSLKNILYRYQAFQTGWDQLADRIVIQLNDTHPTVAIPEMMRLLMDEHGMGWDEAWRVTARVFAYTCHTLMPEALERWPVPLFQSLLPRHIEIIYEINARLLKTVEARFPGDGARLQRMSIIEEGGVKYIRMANLACAACFSINGVAALHTELLKNLTLHDFFELWPEKFNNKTNGISPRRFIRVANPGLSELLDQKAGPGWEVDLNKTSALEPLAGDAAFRAAWQAVKSANKERLAAHIQRTLGITVNPDSMFDVMVKRLHEYKRQMLKAFHILELYNRLLTQPDAGIPDRTFIFGAKAAPAYRQAKLIIKFINDVAAVVNADPRINGRLKVVFLPNFDVSTGELVYPAADLSEQISMAGTEASGTGNMKFALNGALTIGTHDGANIEIREAVGDAHFFAFGLSTEDVQRVKSGVVRPFQFVEADPRLRAVIDRIETDPAFNATAAACRDLLDHLYQADTYLVMADYAAYSDAQQRVEARWRDRAAWEASSILNVARCGRFSSDRTIREYCRDIWNVQPLPVGGGTKA